VSWGLALLDKDGVNGATQMCPDISFAADNDFCDLDGKLARVATDGVKAWVDPTGYCKWLAAATTRFEAVEISQADGAVADSRACHTSMRERSM
jgi:hypothetical protein